MVSHAGGDAGYLSNLFLFPDVKLGIFVSTTTTFSLIEAYDISPMIATFVADMVLGQSPTFDVAAACAYTTRAALPLSGEGNNIDFHCEDASLESFADTFLHPVYDPFIVSFAQQRQQLNFSVGIFGNGLLCNKSFENKKNTFQMLFTDPTMVRFGLNTPAFRSFNGFSVTFGLDSDGKAEMIKVYGLDTEYALDFYRKDVFDRLPSSGIDNRASLGFSIFVLLSVCFSFIA